MPHKRFNRRKRSWKSINITSKYFEANPKVYILGYKIILV